MYDNVELRLKLFEPDDCINMCMMHSMYQSLLSPLNVRKCLWQTNSECISQKCAYSIINKMYVCIACKKLCMLLKLL